MNESVVAHFFGGPLDGEQRAIQGAPLDLRVHQAPKLHKDRYELRPDIIYLRRGEPLVGNAFYDYEGEAARG